MDNVSGNEKNNRYGLAWKKSGKTRREKIFDLKKAHKKCVLVTDSCEKELNNIFNILRKYNYDVFIVRNKENAWEISRKKPYDLLINIIPGMAGIDLLSKIKNFEPETEVMIVSGLELLESCLETINSEASTHQKELNKTPVLDKNSIKDYLQNEFRLLTTMDYCLEDSVGKTSQKLINFDCFVACISSR